MSVESYSTAVANQLTLPEPHRLPQGYFRSKLFVSASTTNPLVAAASPLLSLLERLCLSPTLPQIDTIRSNIEHELLAFHSRLGGQHYANEFTLIANYLITATVDELLGKNYMRLFDEAPEFKAFTPISPQGAEPQQLFFDIIDFIKQRTHQYLDIIELAYYCLIAGFEGQHHVRADGRQHLDNLIEELHQLISQHRVHKPHRLFNEHTRLAVEPKHRKPMIIATLVTMTIIASLYTGSHFLLEYKAKTIVPKHTAGLTSQRPARQHG